MDTTAISNPGSQESSGTSGGGNPWDISPAVTASQSELSSNTNTSQPPATADGDVTAAIPNVNRTEGNQVPDLLSGSPPDDGVVTPGSGNVAGAALTDGTTSAPAVEDKQNNVEGTAMAISADGIASDNASTSALSKTTTEGQQQQQQQQQPHATVPVSNYPLDNALTTVKSTTSAAATPLPPDPPTGPETTDSHTVSPQQPASPPRKPPEDPPEEEPQGGRLWQAALQEATESPHKQSQAATQTPSKMGAKFAESIMERTRSRADPNALVSNGKNGSHDDHHHPTLTVHTSGYNNDPDTAFILTTALAKKRVRVVQLLLIGLVGLLLGLLGNFFVSTSCHFATVNVVVGANKYNNNQNNANANANANNAFEFHFGLWKYTPIDSVFQGYSYCYKYDDNYNSDAPVVARITNISALVTGLIAISVLWAYLIFGYANKQHWQCAVGIAGVAGLLQGLTVVSFFFLGTICSQDDHECSMGPGGYLSVFTSLVWIILACEMHYHTPIASYAHSGSMMDVHAHPDQYQNTGHGGGGIAARTPSSARSLVQTVEMTKVDEVAREYITRVTGPVNGIDGRMPSLSRTADLTQKHRPKLGIRPPTPTPKTKKGTYQPPVPSAIV